MENEQQLLDELKVLNENLSKDLELRKEELKQKKVDSERQENLQEVSDKEQEQKQLEESKKEEVSEKRAKQIEEFIVNFQDQIDSDNDFKKQQIQVLSKLDNEKQLNSIDQQLVGISEKLDVTDDQQQESNVYYFTSMTIIIFLLFAVPAVATYKFLTRLFNGFIA